MTTTWLDNHSDSDNDNDLTKTVKITMTITTAMTKTCIFQEANYARWMAACRMAAKGKSMADSGYDYEVKSIQVTKIEEKLKQKLTELKHVE
jgi:hypothetical protein